MPGSGFENRLGAVAAVYDRRKHSLQPTFSAVIDPLQYVFGGHRPPLQCFATLP